MNRAIVECERCGTGNLNRAATCSGGNVVCKCRIGNNIGPTGLPEGHRTALTSRITSEIAIGDADCRRATGTCNGATKPLSLIVGELTLIN